jgi:hypothetical protein
MNIAAVFTRESGEHFDADSHLSHGKIVKVTTDHDILSYKGLFQKCVSYFTVYMLLWSRVALQNLRS